MKKEEAGKINYKTNSVARVALGNQSGKGEDREAKSNDSKEGERKGTSIEIYRKLNRLPSGRIIGLHWVQHLGKHDQDRVLISLVVTKGSCKFSRTNEELARKWMWHRK